jgi:catechol-2,3-dioxygenase
MTVRTPVSATLEYTPQTRRRRRNSTGTFLAWRSPAGARPSKHVSWRRISRIKFVFNHRQSFAFYFDDPDGNMIEVYWSTGDLSRKQPQVEPLDLSRPDEVLLKHIKATR